MLYKENSEIKEKNGGNFLTIDYKNGNVTELQVKPALSERSFFDELDEQKKSMAFIPRFQPKPSHLYVVNKEIESPRSEKSQKLQLSQRKSNYGEEKNLKASRYFKNILSEKDFMEGSRTDPEVARLLSIFAFCHRSKPNATKTYSDITLDSIRILSKKGLC